MRAHDPLFTTECVHHTHIMYACTCVCLRESGLVLQFSSFDVAKINFRDLDSDRDRDRDYIYIYI